MKLKKSTEKFSARRALQDELQDSSTLHMHCMSSNTLFRKNFKFTKINSISHLTP